MLLALAGAERRGIFRRAGLLPLVVLGAMQALVAVISLSSLRYISAATLSFLFYTYPAWIAVIAAVRRTEPLTRPRIIALAVALVGIAIMVGTPSGDIHAGGVVLALASALLYAMYVPIIEGFQRRQGGAAVATYAAAGAAAIFLVAALAFPGFTAGLRVPTTLAAWAAVAWMAVFATAIAFKAFLRGLAIIGPVRSGIVSTIEPFATALMAAALLGQPLTLATLAGGACVAIAVLLLQRAQQLRAAASPL